MRLLPLLQVLLLVSCGASRSLRFEGRNLLDGESGLVVTGMKEESILLAANVRHGFIVAIPYAEDWTFDPTPQKPVFGSSASLHMAVTVQPFQPGSKVEEEAFLRSEYLPRIKARCEQEGIPTSDFVITPGNPAESRHPVLEYRHEIPMPNGETFRQAHFWSFRQREDEVIYEIHFSTMYKDPAGLEKLRKGARLIVGQKFMLKEFEVPPK